MEKEIKISSKIDNLLELEIFLNTLMREAKISRKVFCKLYLAVNEAVTNAIIHGNKLDSDKYIEVLFFEDERGYSFKIIDQGDGFSVENVVDPLLNQNLKNESGRGIFIMKNYSDDINFFDNGRCVHLFFKK